MRTIRDIPGLAIRFILAMILGPAVAGLLILEVGLEVHPLLVFGSIPILATFALVAVNALTAQSGQDDELWMPSRPRTAWRLIDPRLLKTGVWRAETASRLPADPLSQVGGSPSDADVRTLMEDWSHRSGWRSEGMRITRTDTPRSGSDPCASQGPVTYRVTWEPVGWSDESAPRPLPWGWLSLGRDHAEFQLEIDECGRPRPETLDDDHPAALQPSRCSAEKPASGHRAGLRPPPTPPLQGGELSSSPLAKGGHRGVSGVFDNAPSQEKDRPESVPEAATVPIDSGQHPLWDRWLDG
jgi:hypothetical protein